MIRFKQNKKGGAITYVIIIMSVMVLFLTYLSRGTIQSFGSTKRQANIEVTYYSAHSAIEEWFLDIENLIESNLEDIILNLNVNRNEDYGDDIAQKIFDLLKDEGEHVKKISVLDEDSQSEVFIHELENMEATYNTASGDIEIILGILARAAHKTGIFTAVNQEVFAQREFVIPYGREFRLEGAVYTIGDLFVDGNGKINGSNETGGASNSFGVNATITGDVFVHGTFPEKTLIPKIYYYGGIFAKREAGLTINGHAIVRSNIRTGRYHLNSEDDMRGVGDYDGSEIRILGDAIAQGITPFGANTGIIVGGDAYTFDDVEINGANSVVAINGSYFGLQDGNLNDHHDNSSSIVNSAILHNGLTDESYKSRVVVNGDVFINGGTYRVDSETGEAKHQIEEGAFVLDESNFPLYWEFETTYDNVAKDTALYGDLLQNANGEYSNLIFLQRWNVQSPGSINSWLTDIRRAINGQSNAMIPTPDEITGYGTFYIGANNRIYRMLGTTSDTNLAIANKTPVLQPAELTDVLDQDPQISSNTWRDVLESGEVYRDELDFTVFPALTQRLKNHSEVFISPKYNYDDNGDLIEHKAALRGASPQFEKVLEELNFEFPQVAERISVNGRNVDIAKYDNQVINIGSTGDSGDVNIATLLSEVMDDYDLSNYYLIINNNWQLELSLYFDFNGIIFTTGKVNLYPGVNIEGSIVAAGKSFIGDNPDNRTSASDSYRTGESNTYHHSAPRVLDGGVNYNNFKNGDYAAIHIRGNGGGEAVNITFPGRDYLLGQFTNSYLTEIF